MTYVDQFAWLSRNALHMVDTKALKISRFSRGLAMTMCTTLSSQVRKLTYVKVVNIAMRMETRRIEKKASREAAKKPKVQGSFMGGSSSRQDMDSKGNRRFFSWGLCLLGPLL